MNLAQLIEPQSSDDEQRLPEEKDKVYVKYPITDDIETGDYNIIVLPFASGMLVALMMVSMFPASAFPDPGEHNYLI